MMQPKVQVVTAGDKMARKLRSPKHTFRVAQRPFLIQPIMIAPVLPGETMTNLLLQSRVVTDPLAGRLTGWWCEYYFFYVKHRDLEDISDELVAMHLDASYDTTSINSAAAAQFYHNGGINFTSHCLDAVTKWYFRDDEEVGATIDGLPLAAKHGNGWWDSLKLESEDGGGTASDELPGENPVIPDNVPSGFENHFSQWEAMRAMNITDKSFEDYLASFGVKTPEVQEFEARPELIRYVRDFQYPSNTIEPTDGTATSAVSWSIAERADKDRFFKEPGFLFGCQVVRPKLYLKNLSGSLSHYMNGAFNWLPAVLHSQAYTSLKEFGEDAGPIDASLAIGEDYWVDLRDLLVHGDQFFNAKDEIESGALLPTATLNKDYPDSNDLNSLFSNVENNLVHSDGVVSLSIKSHIREMT